MFAGTMHGPVFVGDEQPRESFPWYRKTPFAVAFMAVAGCAFAALVLLMVGKGALTLLGRGHALPSSLRLLAMAFVVIWSACTVANMARLVKCGAGRMGAFDFVSGAASPALTAGGLVAYPLYLAASPVFAGLCAAAIAYGVVSIFKDPVGRPLESRLARALEVGAVAGTLLLMAFMLYTL